MLEKVDKDIDALGEGSDKYAAVLAKENKQIDEGNALIDLAEQAYAKHKITRDQLNDAIDKGNALIDMANQRARENTAILDQQAQSLGGLITRYEDQTRELDLMTKGEQTVAKAVDQATKYWLAHREEMEHNNITLEDAQARAAAVAQKFADLSQQVKLNAEAAHEWQSIWS